MKLIIPIIIFLIIGIFIGFSLNQIKDNPIVGMKQKTPFETCIYQTKTGVNILPNKDICCNTISKFLKCEPTNKEITYGEFSIQMNRQCFNKKDGDLKLYLNEDLLNYCKTEGFSI